MGNKGFSLTELILVMFLSSSFLILAISIPTDLFKYYYHYDNLVDDTRDIIYLNTLITRDLSELTLTEVDTELGTIKFAKDNVEYNFSDKVKRNTLKVSNYSFNITLEGNFLYLEKQDNSEIKLKFNVKSSSFN